MPYDANMDKILHSWENEETGLTVNICQYGEGEAKVQVGPRNYTKKDGTKRASKAGRLPIDDVLWLADIIEEVRDKMNEIFLEQSAG